MPVVLVGAASSMLGAASGESRSESVSGRSGAEARTPHCALQWNCSEPPPAVLVAPAGTPSKPFTRQRFNLKL